MHSATRVQNEVALISLAAAALDYFNTHVVPRIYGWGAPVGEPQPAQGWTLQELLPGMTLEDALPTMDLQRKEQDFELPETITGFGGVTFDPDGRIVSAVMPTVGEGPWPTYEASFKGRLAVALQKAGDNSYIKGWHANGLRKRLDAWVKRGLPAHFEGLTSKDEKAIIHSDFAASSILYDAESGRITGLIGYDFSCVLHPSYEFLRSFSNLGGQFRGWTTD
ncbi:hypothetical protein B0H63DRAFT_454462 [Podospora didyma]|uniref:Aminoglycoside phosphotransferase domain-containing protein n=1 Tax=Podospora didyma TaxID=330526 RepID=A0AAE0N4A4_9PEZI|nr:hypothetical protein B0H63DRAFT_454462 [Podospora didyma]